jgi:hypothetical protein
MPTMLTEAQTFDVSTGAISTVNYAQGITTGLAANVKEVVSSVGIRSVGGVNLIIAEFGFDNAGAVAKDLQCVLARSHLNPSSAAHGTTLADGNCSLGPSFAVNYNGTMTLVALDPSVNSFYVYHGYVEAGAANMNAEGNRIRAIELKR